MTTSNPPLSPSAQAPFAGLKVVDASNMVMVPSAAVVMADFGAEVVKVEPPSGDLNRRGHLIPGMPKHAESYCFFQDNRNKKSIALDLKTTEGRDILRSLLERSDVFFTNTRRAALERLGLDFESLHQLNPRLIFAHGTGYGAEGPERNKPGFDAVCYWSRSGLETTIFPQQGQLGPLPYGSGDHPSGMSLLSAVLIALYQRERTGLGTEVSTSLVANGIWSNAITIQARLLGAEFAPLRPREDPINFAAVYYRAACGRPFKFTIIDHQATWPRFCRALRRPDLVDDARYSTTEARAQVMGEIVALADVEFARADLETWRTRFGQEDVAFSELASYDEIVNDEQITANGGFLEIEHPRLGRVRTVDNPLRVEGAHRPRPLAAPDLGEHSREILEGLGLEHDRIQHLFESGVVC